MTSGFGLLPIAQLAGSLNWKLRVWSLYTTGTAGVVVLGTLVLGLGLLCAIPEDGLEPLGWAVFWRVLGCGFVGCEICGGVGVATVGFGGVNVAAPEGLEFWLPGGVWNAFLMLSAVSLEVLLAGFLLYIKYTVPPIINRTRTANINLATKLFLSLFAASSSVSFWSLSSWSIIFNMTEYFTKSV